MTAIVSRDNYIDKLTLHFKRFDTFDAVKNLNKGSGILQLNKIYSFVISFCFENT